MGFDGSLFAASSRIIRREARRKSVRVQFKIILALRAPRDSSTYTGGANIVPHFLSIDSEDERGPLARVCAGQTSNKSRREKKKAESCAGVIFFVS